MNTKPSGSLLSVKRTLFSGISLVGFALCALPAAAQQPAPKTSPVAGEATPAASKAPEGQEEVVVTGSRITRRAVDSPTPLTVVSAKDMKARGETNITSIVSRIPALTGSRGSADSTFGNQVGVNELNLRNLGAARTLLLINGQRHVGADPLGTSAVDTNVIPLALVERVEVTTGGASAIYGADGVSGVVNFILKKDFEGLRVSAQTGLSSQNDAASYYLSLVGGKNFADGKGNVTLSAEFDRQNPLIAKDREQFSTGSRWLMNNPASPRPAGAPAAVLLGNIRDSFVAADSIIDPFGIFGGPWRGGVRLDAGNPVGSPGAGVPSATIGGNGTELWRIMYWGLIPKTEHLNLSLMAHYEIAPSTKLFANLSFSNVRARSVQQSTFTIISRTFNDNPFLPTVVRNAAIAAGAGNPVGPGAPLMYDRFDIDSGGKRVSRNSDTWRFVTGVDGDINDHLSYNVTFNYGRTDTTSYRSLRLDDRYFAASDVTTDAQGRPVCRSTINPGAFANTPVDVLSKFNPAGGAITFTPGANSGCVPFNAFIDDPVANAAAYNWIYTTAPITGTLTQTVLSGYLKGDSTLLGFELPGGPASFVLGAEYRRESSKINFPAMIETGPVFVFDRGAKDQSGKFDVWEVFTEVSLPLVKDGGLLMRELTVDGAYRYSNYSTIGSTNAWAARLIWSPIEDVKMRATLSSAIRAPNINELFGATQPQNFLPVDPCSVGNLNLGSSSRRANCTAALNALGLPPTLTLPSTAVNFIGSSGGNPNLQAESARTFTVGLVLEPSFAPGLQVTLDYWRIKMSNGIVTPTGQDIVNACYDAPTLSNPFCPLLSRAPNGDLNGLSVRQLNVAAFITSGIDFGVRYGTDIGAGRLTVDVNGTWLERLDLQGTLDGKLDNERGEENTLLGGTSPEWTINLGLNWEDGPLSLRYDLNYRTSVLLVENDTVLPPAQLQIPYRSNAVAAHSVRAAYRLNDHLEVYGGVRNITDEMPTPGSFRTSTPVDAIGRYFFAGITFDL